MKFYSETLKKLFDSAEELRAAEDKANEAKKAALEKQKKLSEERKLRANEVNDAYKKLVAASKHFETLKTNFIKDYGSFHMTYTDEDSGSFSLFDSIFDLFFR